MPCPAHPYHHLKYTDLHINLQRQEFQAGLEGGKDSWEKKKLKEEGLAVLYGNHTMWEALDFI